MKTRFFWLFILLCGYFYACKEGERYGLDVASSGTPDAPNVLGTLPMEGGVRFYYTIPQNDDILAVKAEYVNEFDETLMFSASYFTDSLDVIGFADTVFYDVKIYAVNRAGKRSQEKTYKVKPLQSVVSLVAKSIEVKIGFGEFFVQWKNDLEWSVNVHVHFKFKQQGLERDLLQVFTSSESFFRGYVLDLNEVDNDELEIQVRVEDVYGNSTPRMSFGKMRLKQDIKIPKKNVDGTMKWTMPYPNDSIGGIPQLWGNFGEGHNDKLIDDIINIGRNNNFIHTNYAGRTGTRSDGNGWNVLINLGDIYELSRCLTHQRHEGGDEYRTNKGFLYGAYNVGIYNMYILDESVRPPQWVFIHQHKIPIPTNVPDLEVCRLGIAGDMAYFYPDDPQFTPPTRWFRYEMINGFGANYTAFDNVFSLSEITLFGRKTQK